MKVREFLNCCRMPWDKVDFSYYGDADKEIPQVLESYRDMRRIPEKWLDKSVDTWSVIVTYEPDGDEFITIIIEV